MKLRIHGNSIRLRLNRAEVAQFGDKGVVEDTIQFGPGAALAYSLERSGDGSIPHATFEGGAIRITVPSEAAGEWTTTERVDIRGEQQIEEGDTLSITVEKDFQCLHKDDEENAEAYPNPAANTPLVT